MKKMHAVIRTVFCMGLLPQQLLKKTATEGTIAPDSRQNFNAHTVLYRSKKISDADWIPMNIGISCTNSDVASFAFNNGSLYMCDPFTAVGNSGKSDSEMGRGRLDSSVQRDIAFDSIGNLYPVHFSQITKD